MSSRARAVSDGLEHLVGRQFPEGHFVLDDERHTEWMAATQGRSAGVTMPAGIAHPLFGYLAAHGGLGIELDELFALAGADLEAGVLFGEGSIVFDAPLRVGATYRVRSGITRVGRKRGRRAGLFDTLTVGMEVFDDEDRVCTAEETLVFPRSDVDG